MKTAPAIQIALNLVSGASFSNDMKCHFTTSGDLQRVEVPCTPDGSIHQSTLEFLNHKCEELDCRYIIRSQLVEAPGLSKGYTSTPVVVIMPK